MVTSTRLDRRLGAIRLPEADQVIGREDDPALPQPGVPVSPVGIDPGELLPRPFPGIPGPIFPFRFCRTTLKEGCYTFSFRPSGVGFFGPFFRGTMRVERVGNGYRISADLYRFPPLIVLPPAPRPGTIGGFTLGSEDADDSDGVIPIFPRKRYFSYFKGTSAQLISFVPRDQPCRFTLNFEEFRYNQPPSGFSGSFDASPDRSVRFELEHSSSIDLFTGKAFEGASQIGTVSIRWVSPRFRRATLEIHTLDNAVTPPTVPASSGVGVENFKTVFASAGWQLSVVDGGTIPLPASLQGVQDPNQCWSPANSATLMATVPGYDPSELDTVWKARLLAIPARIGCSRGRMFDSGSGDPNAVAREGAVTHSHDGYPAADSSNFGAAEGQMQKDVPRAYLRSASHEVGHTFNQIHQVFEAGSDNSIMTVTPSVADVLAAGGGSFPDDIELAFNETVRRHLKHLPDPAVRPGAMAFFGSAVTAPQADQVSELDELAMVLEPHSWSVRMGEPVSMRWTLTNQAENAVPVPSEMDPESLVLRINITDPDGNITFLRPAHVASCRRISLISLAPNQSVSGETTVFWGREGFAFTRPGRHTVEVIALWEINGIPVMAAGQCPIWVAFPVSAKDNDIAALLMDEHVGMAVATGRRRANPEGERRIAEAAKLQKTHPACRQLAELGLV